VIENILSGACYTIELEKHTLLFQDKLFYISDQPVYKGELQMMKRKLIVILLVGLLLFNYGQIMTTQLVSASIKTGEMVTLTQSGQVLETIEYNGITVEAVYTNSSYSRSDTTYSCAAFVKKFYKMVYGVTVYNLNSPSSEPLIYDNKGSFSITDNPQKGDIVRDNTRTHWAIVKDVSENFITIIQQNYRSGAKAWINCTIDKADSGFSYFTYSNRIPDASQSGQDAYIGDGTVPGTATTVGDETMPNNATTVGDATAPNATTVGDGTVPNAATVGGATVPNAATVDGVGSMPATTNRGGTSSLPTGLEGDASGVSVNGSSASSAAVAQLHNGTYLLIQGIGTAFMEAAPKEKDWHIQTAQYSGLDDQKLSIINHGNNQYSLQFLSDHRFLSISDTMQCRSTDTLEQKYVFEQRMNGYYTIALAENRDKIIAVEPQSKEGCGGLVLKEFSGNLNELWCLNMVSDKTLPILPKVTVNRKTLYVGYQDYKINIKQLMETANVTYTTSDPEIASVNAEGSIHPVSKGKVIITVEVKQENNTYTDQISVTVKELSDRIKAPKKN
jgi:hypothetical protein